MWKKFFYGSVVLSFFPITTQAEILLEKADTSTLTPSITREIKIEVKEQNINNELNNSNDQAFRDGIRFINPDDESGTVNKIQKTLDGEEATKIGIKTLYPSGKVVTSTPGFKNPTSSPDPGVFIPENKTLTLKITAPQVDLFGKTSSSQQVVKLLTPELEFKPWVKLRLSDRYDNSSGFEYASPSQPYLPGLGDFQKIFAFAETNNPTKTLPETSLKFSLQELYDRDAIQAIEFDYEQNTYPPEKNLSSSNLSPDKAIGFVSFYIRLKEGFAQARDFPMAFASQVNYQVDDMGTPKNISYPGGNLGQEVTNGNSVFAFENGDSIDRVFAGDNTEVKSLIIGADIEGQILSGKDNITYQYDSESEESGAHFLRLGNISIKDIREDVITSAYTLIKGLEPNDCGKTISDLNFMTKNVWFFRCSSTQPTVTLESSTITGVGTIIIQNGNLFIKEDMKYQDKSYDSLGVILINTVITPYPNTGNIFVNNDIKSMVGTYYADGSLISTNAGTSPTIENEKTKEESPLSTTTDLTYRSDNRIFGNQLILEGTIFTQNTLGGATQNRTFGPAEFLTPWGNTNEESVGQRYDLNFIRRYQPPRYTVEDDAEATKIGQIKLDIENNQCTKINDNDCDPSNHSFIIRPDKKVTNIPPPGFKW